MNDDIDSQGWADSQYSYYSVLYDENKGKSISEEGWDDKEDKKYHLNLMKEEKIIV